MALIKDITLENGIPTNYHRIQSISKLDKILNVIVVSYVNKNYRTQGIINYVNTQTFSFELENDNVSFESTYNLLKTIDIFNDAEDD